MKTYNTSFPNPTKKTRARSNTHERRSTIHKTYTARPHRATPPRFFHLLPHITRPRAAVLPLLRLASHFQLTEPGLSEHPRPLTGLPVRGGAAAAEELEREGSCKKPKEELEGRTSNNIVVDRR